MSEITLSVPEMSCGHCVNTIQSSMKQLAGVQHVDVKLDEKLVHLRYDDSVSLATIQETLDDAGYTSAPLA